MLTLKEIHSVVMTTVRKIEISAWRHDLREVDGLSTMVSTMLFSRDYDSDPRVRPTTEEEKKELSYVESGEYTEFDVGVNKIYGIEVKAGEHYEFTIEPWGILEWEDVKLPVYADDPGQCDYIRLDGELLGAGAYNPSPEGEFIFFYYEYILEKLRDKLANLHQED